MIGLMKIYLFDLKVEYWIWMLIRLSSGDKWLRTLKTKAEKYQPLIL